MQRVEPIGYTQFIEHTTRQDWDNHTIYHFIDPYYLQSIHISTIAEVLKRGLCPSQMSFQCKGWRFDDQSIRHLANALQSYSCPSQLKFYLQFNTQELLEPIIDALKKSSSVVNLSCDLKFEPSLNSMIFPRIIDALKHNTSLIMLDINFMPNIFLSRCYPVNLVEIDHCCLRNRLLEKYREKPDMVNYIKKLSQEAGMYIPPINKKNISSHVYSLYFLSGLSCVTNKDKIINYSAALKILSESCAETHEFIMQLENFNAALKSEKTLDSSAAVKRKV